MSGLNWSWHASNIVTKSKVFVQSAGSSPASAIRNIYNKNYRQKHSGYTYFVQYLLTILSIFSSSAFVRAMLTAASEISTPSTEQCGKAVAARSLFYQFDQYGGTLWECCYLFCGTFLIVHFSFAKKSFWRNSHNVPIFIEWNPVPQPTSSTRPPVERTEFIPICISQEISLSLLFPSAIMKWQIDCYMELLKILIHFCRLDRQMNMPNSVNYEMLTRGK